MPTPPGADEAQRIYRAIFGGDIPAVLADRFSEPSATLDASAGDGELSAYRNALLYARDLEALEVTARFRRRLPLLTRKFQLMVYLAETLPDHQHYFIAETDGWMRGAITVMTGAARTAVKLCKGALFMRRYLRA